VLKSGWTWVWHCFYLLTNTIITDITGNNPNVIFELGWALAKGKTPIIIRQKDDNQPVPFDIQNYRHIKYVDSWSGVESLCKQITKFLKSTSGQSDRGKPKEISN